MKKWTRKKYLEEILLLVRAVPTARTAVADALRTQDTPVENGQQNIAGNDLRDNPLQRFRSIFRSIKRSKAHIQRADVATKGVDEEAETHHCEPVAPSDTQTKQLANALSTFKLPPFDEQLVCDAVGVLSHVHRKRNQIRTEICISTISCLTG